jgi:Fe-S cluster assembly protein SufD
MSQLAATRVHAALASAAERFDIQFRKKVTESVSDTYSDALRSMKSESFERFRAVGFPAHRDEAWRFTSLAAFAGIEFTTAAHGLGPILPALTEERLQSLTFTDDGCNRLVFYNGHFCQYLSVLRAMPLGAEVLSLGLMLSNNPERVLPYLTAALGRENLSAGAFQMLNSAFFENGAYVFLPAGARVYDPIHLVFLSSATENPTVSYPRSLIVAEAGAAATIIESYVGVDVNSETKHTYLTNAVTDVFLGDSAAVEHYKFQHESEAAFHVGSLRVHQERGSAMVSHSIALGGRLVRNDIAVVLDGEGADCVLNGIYATAGAMHVDNHTLVDHAQAGCTSQELYKGIIGDESRGVFCGKVLVREDAQKSSAQQENKNLLLSDGASINTKPELAILANDVKCTHGATIGRLDEEALFYLRSRGISEGAARTMLTTAFAGEVLARIKVGALLEKIQAVLECRFDEWRLHDA